MTGVVIRLDGSSCTCTNIISELNCLRSAFYRIFYLLFFFFFEFEIYSRNITFYVFCKHRPPPPQVIRLITERVIRQLINRAAGWVEMACFIVKFGSQQSMVKSHVSFAARPRLECCALITSHLTPFTTCACMLAS